MTVPRLQLASIGLSLGSFALEAVSLRLESGRCLVLLGPTGCGKTLLAEIICGLRAPDSGRVLINGRDVTACDPARRGIGYVPQDHALLPFKTVAGNVAFGLQARRLARHEIDRRVTAMLTRLGIAHLADRYPAGLSGGERQRVALARALVIEPALLVLDEPLSALDEGTGEELISLLRELRRDLGTTVLHICHRLDEAFALADDLAVIRAGRIEQIDRIHAITQHPVSLFVARFLRLRNLISGTVEQAQSGRVFRVCGIDWLSTDLPLGPAWAVVPWQGIRLNPEPSADKDQCVVPMRIVDNHAQATQPSLQLEAITIPGIFVGQQWQPGAVIHCHLPREQLCLLTEHGA